MYIESQGSSHGITKRFILKFPLLNFPLILNYMYFTKFHHRSCISAVGFRCSSILKFHQNEQKPWIAKDFYILQSCIEVMTKISNP